MTAVGSKGRTQGVVCSGCAWWVQTSNTLFSAYSSCLHLNRGTTNKSKMPNQLPASMTPSYTSHTTSQLRHSNLLFLLEEGFLPPCCFSCLHRFSPTLSQLRRVFAGHSLVGVWQRALLGSGKQVGFAQSTLAACLQLHTGSLGYHCWPSLTAANNWPWFNSLAGKFGCGREGSGKRAALPLHRGTFGMTPRDSPLLAQVEMSHPFPRHPAPRTRSQL